MSMVSKSIEINAPAKKCYEVIWDFENYLDFIKDLKDVEVSKKKGNTCEVTYTIEVIKKISYSLKMQGKPHEKIEWTFIRGDIMKDNHGFWDLEEVKKGITLATYNIEIKFPMLVPSTVTKALVGKNLPEMLAAFKKRIEGKK